MTATILFSNGPIRRIVRSQRLFKGVHVGAIRDKGYLIMVRFDGIGESGCWTPLHVIRKCK